MEISAISQALEQAETLKVDGKYAEALSILEGILAIDPGNIVALEEIADNELSLDHYDRAAAAAKQAISLDPKSYMSHYILGFIASHFEDWSTSIQELKIANDFKQNNEEILRCLGWALFSSGKISEGLVTLERALNLDAENPLVLCDLGVVYLRLQEFSKARALFQRSLDIDPSNSRAMDCLQMVDRISNNRMTSSSTK